MAKYSGSVTTTGKSEAIRFEKGLFRQNPEFKQQAKVEAHIIGPGQMLVSVVNNSELNAGDDPLVAAFLSFLEKDMNDNPSGIMAVSTTSIARAKELTKDVVVSDDDTIADDVTF